MATQPYMDPRTGKRVPGVTTVIGRNLAWNKDALMGWANREGLEGRNIKDRFNNPAVRAADIGTAAHNMIEGYTLGYDPYEFAGESFTSLNEEDKAKAKNGFSGFVRWFRGSNVRIAATELFGVDLDYRTGFCIDALGWMSALLEGEPDSLDLYDWKSSKATYADHFIQTSAYTVFTEKKLTEWIGRPIRLGGAHVVRVDKENGMFSHKFWPREDLERGWKVFTWLRAIDEERWPIEKYTR
jgi:hypothetical protein